MTTLSHHAPAPAPDDGDGALSEARLRSAVRAMEAISRCLARPVEGPRALLQQVVCAAGSHLGAEWVLLALTDGQLTSARPRCVAVDAAGRLRDVGELPPLVRRELVAIRAGLVLHNDASWVRVAMTLEGRPIGSLSLLCGEVALDAGDVSILRILANQAAVSLHTAEHCRAGARSHHPARHRYDEATTTGHEPAVEVKLRAPMPGGTLTARECEVLGLLALGCSNREIGARLYISETTAKFHVGNILRKLGSSSRAEAVYAATQLGVI